MNNTVRNTLGICAGLTLAVATALADNVLTNPGFESDAPGQSQNLVGWTWYGQSWGNTFNETGAEARSGNNYFKVFPGFTKSINYSGIQQDYPAAPGTTYTAEGWAKMISSDSLTGSNVAWIEVSFRDAHANQLALYRSSLINTNAILAGTFPKDTWVSLPITNQYDPNNYTVTNTTTMLVAPPGTTVARYQVVLQGDVAGSTGSVYFDDLTLNLTSPAATAPAGDWRLVWSDEFNQPDGSAPDATKWSYETGGNGWGNHELEYYTSRTNNARIEAGKLVIEAREESFSGKNYTSARLLTKGKHAWTYGRIEARMKIPHGQGIWPAFWMLGANIASTSWPTCGEIDIMENIGREPGLIHGTVHGPGYSGSGGIGGPASLPGGSAFADDFHVYSIEWETNRIRWSVDGQPYFTVTPASLPPGTKWVYNQPQFMLLNLAVGGAWPGNPNATTILPQRMVVDYVRVYQKSVPPLPAQNLRISN